MTIFYPYNELLPKQTAHAIYIFFSTFFFAKQGQETTLAYGKKNNFSQLSAFYNLPEEKKLFLQPIFHIRKNNPLNLSWNTPFFFLCQKKIEKLRPNIVITSVRKQAAYHIERRAPNVRYIYEVHELLSYNQMATQATLEEKKMLQKHDLVITSTHELKTLLRQKPYSLTNRIEVVPLATHAKALESPTFSDVLQLFYIGSLNPEQNVKSLIFAISKTQKTHLTLIGGREDQIKELRLLAEALGIEKKLTFLGFHPPFTLQSLVKKADAFVAPFTNQGKMAYVAHSKLADYTAWNRPLIVPDLPIVQEHVDPHSFFYQSEENLASTIQLVESPLQRKEWHAKKTLFDLSWETRTRNYLKILKEML